MGNQLRKKGVQKHPPSPADEADALALDRAVEEMIEGPLSKWDHTRPLGSLNRGDLQKLAMAAIVGWVLQRTANGLYADTTDAEIEPFMGAC